MGVAFVVFNVRSCYLMIWVFAYLLVIYLLLICVFIVDLGLLAWLDFFVLRLLLQLTVDGEFAYCLLIDDLIVV